MGFLRRGRLYTEGFLFSSPSYYASTASSMLHPLSKNHAYVTNHWVDISHRDFGSPRDPRCSPGAFCTSRGRILSKFLQKVELLCTDIRDTTPCDRTGGQSTENRPVKIMLGSIVRRYDLQDNSSLKGLYTCLKVLYGHTVDTPYTMRV